MLVLFSLFCNLSLGRREIDSSDFCFRVRPDMDVSDSDLMGAHGYCTQVYIFIPIRHFRNEKGPGKECKISRKSINYTGMAHHMKEHVRIISLGKFEKVWMKSY